MKRALKYIFSILSFAVFYGEAGAAHLVGGSMSYEFVSKTGNNYTYQVTLKVYRDCWGGGADFDPVARVAAYENVGALDLLQVFDFTLTSSSSVNPPQGSNCSGLPSVCLEEGIYTRTITLPGSAFGFHLKYERCCRNDQINIFSSNGQTYYAFIPATSKQNSSPVFTGVPSPYICINDTTTIFNSAADPDGDSLTYQLVHPWTGGSSGDPTPSPAFNFSFPGGVNYRSGYSATQPFGSNGHADVDKINGLTYLYPVEEGKFSIAIEVTEWRNGVKLSQVRLDVQIIVIKCAPNAIPSAIPVSGNYYREVMAGETICFDVQGFDLDNPAQKVILRGRGEVFGNNPGWQGPKATFPTATGTSSATSTFCWATSCTQARLTPYTFVADVIDDGCPPKSRSVAFSIMVKQFDGKISFSGPKKVCDKDTGLTYSSTFIPGYKYKWGISGGTIIGPDTLDKIKVDWGSPGNAKVTLFTTSTEGCVSTVQEYPVSIGNYPAPFSIPTDSICQFKDTLYQFTPTPGSSYTWLITGGTLQQTHASGQAIVKWGGYGQGIIGIIEISDHGCLGDTGFSTVDIIRPEADSLFGSRSVCPHIRGVDYSTNGYASSYYHWKIEGGTIVAGQGTPDVKVNWGGPGFGKIKVIEHTRFGCTGDSMQTDVLINHILIGHKPVGNDSMCEFTGGVPYTVVYTAGSDYFWSVQGGTLTKFDTTHNAVVDWGVFGNAKVSVYEISYDSVNNIPCIGSPVSLDIVLHPIPTADTITGKLKVCDGDMGLIYGLAGFPGSKYKWTINNDSTGINGQGNPNITMNINGTGTYNLKVIETSQYGCVGKPVLASLLVTPKPNTAPIKGDSIVCYPNFNSRLYSTKGLNGSTFKWLFDGGGIEAGDGTPQVAVNFSGQKYNILSVLETSVDGCRGDTQTKKIYADRPFLNIHKVSVGFPDNHINLTWQLDSAPLYAHNFTIQRRIPEPSRAWVMAGTVPGDVFKYTDTNLNTDNHPYEYAIRGINLCGTPFLSPVHKNVWLNGLKPESHALDLAWTHYFGWPDGVNSYEVYRKNDAERLFLFSRNTGLDTVYNYGDGMKNYVQRYRIAALPNGGTDTSWSNEIEVIYTPVLWIPNAFTPNDDGLNRVFNMVSGSIKFFKISIYNRWGELLYKSDDVNATWDGRFKGAPVPEGVYIYHVDYMGGDNVMKHDKGSITIIR